MAVAMRFEIHPSIGIARVGDSPTEFYLAPEQAGALPISCDHSGVADLNPDGTEKPVSTFKDDEGRVKRQGARFRMFVFDERAPGGRELKAGDTIEVVNLAPQSSGRPPVGSLPRASGQTVVGQVVDIEWTVYLANKKACWYEFAELEGEHGYASDHKRRNADITDPNARKALIIDPGPQTVSYSKEKLRRARFAQGDRPQSPQSFPPPLQPASITSLGEIMVNEQDGHNRLVVLGGFGNSGSFRTGFGEPRIRDYANNDGWFDDVSDGPVTARLVYKVLTIDGQPVDPGQPLQTYQVEGSAWVVVGYPRYAPQIVDMITMDEVVQDVAVRDFADDPAMYGRAPFGEPRPRPSTPEEWRVWRETATWNPEYRPWFWRDIWPILTRPNRFSWVMDFDPFAGGDPHNTSKGGPFDPAELSVPPHHGESPADRERRRAMRMALYNVLRKPGHENDLTVEWVPTRPGYRPLGMPLLCGDNPLSNTVASKFLRLTDTMLFLLSQWAHGKFVNERREHFPGPASPTARDLDRGVLGNVLGGAFCPGGEVTWIMRNPAIYAAPYRIKLSQDFTPGALDTDGDLAAGLEPGDLTKYSALPWQADFNECSTQDIDITFRDWNDIQPSSTGDPVKPIVQTTYWWPAHRPMQVNVGTDPTHTYQALWSRGIPQSDSGDLEMVTAWKDLGFILEFQTPGGPVFMEVERNPEIS